MSPCPFPTTITITPRVSRIWAPKFTTTIIREWETQFGNLFQRKCIMIQISSFQLIWNNSRRINIIFIAWANLIERIQELKEFLRLHYGEKLLSSSRRFLFRMNVVTCRLTFKHCTVRGTTRGLLEQKPSLSGAAFHSCMVFVVKTRMKRERERERERVRERERERFDFTTRFIILLRSCHLVTIGSVILKSKGWDPYNSK